MTMTIDLNVPIAPLLKQALALLFTALVMALYQAGCWLYWGAMTAFGIARHLIANRNRYVQSYFNAHPLQYQFYVSRMNQLEDWGRLVKRQLSFI